MGSFQKESPNYFSKILNKQLFAWFFCFGNCREVLHEYTTKLSLVNELLLKAMARSLNIEKHSFLKQFGERGTMTARFNLYPPCPRPDLILGVKPHADGSAVTFLLQDSEVEGLQIMKDGQWYRVPIVPHALFVNVGDQAEVINWTLLLYD